MKLPETWLAPAKLNLFLHVTGRREDGYHTLQTAFIFLDYYDRLSFSVNKSGEIRRKDLPGTLEMTLPENDLCVKAAQLLQKVGKVKTGVEISLEKHIPAGSGLGGGSSDAATTLIALNKLWALNLPRETLIELGRELGADIPVFIHGKNTFAEGVGDEFLPLDIAEKAYCVLIPKINVSTAEIFNDSALTRDTPILKIRGSLPQVLLNDLQAVTCRRYPAVKQALKWLKPYGNPLMSGTGSSVFLACDTLALAKQINAQRHLVFGDKMLGFAAKNLYQHPHWHLL